MRNLLVTLTATLALVLSARAADVSAKISDVHLCCGSCVKGVQAAVGKVPGVTVSADKDTGTVTLSGPNKGAVQKAADALVEAGYFGKCSEPGIKLNDNTGAKGKKVQSLEVEGVHLCCGQCVTVVNEALGTVAGVKGNTAAKGAKSFTVTGDFNDKDVFAALHKAGLSGQVAK